MKIWICQHRCWWRKILLNNEKTAELLSLMHKSFGKRQNKLSLQLLLLISIPLSDPGRFLCAFLPLCSMLVPTQHKRPKILNFYEKYPVIYVHVWICRSSHKSFEIVCIPLWYFLIDKFLLVRKHSKKAKLLILLMEEIFARNQIGDLWNWMLVEADNIEIGEKDWTLYWTWKCLLFFFVGWNWFWSRKLGH